VTIRFRCVSQRIELFKRISRDHVLRRRVTDPRGSGPSRSTSIRTRATVGKSLGGISLPLVGPAELFYSLGKTPETYRHVSPSP
jgi:hypothetical protein